MNKFLKFAGITIITIIITTGCRSKNLKSYIKEGESISGNKIGYIEMNKKYFKEIATKESFNDLMEYVDSLEYEYFVIAFEDDKGLYCLGETCIYEDIEKASNGSYTASLNMYGQVKKDKDDVYQYNEYTSEEK